jgi:tRNA A-37 threonylcarbamoyl transferase component Bud32
MNAAALYFVDLPNLRIFMEQVQGPTVKEVVRKLDVRNQLGTYSDGGVCCFVC